MRKHPNGIHVKCVGYSKKYGTKVNIGSRKKGNTKQGVSILRRYRYTSIKPIPNKRSSNKLGVEMIYTEKMFKKDFKSKDLSFKDFDYQYFKAYQDINKFDNNWASEDSYMVSSVKDGGHAWIYKCNVNNNIREGEVFIGAVNKCKFRQLISVCRGTGLVLMPKKRKLKRCTRIAIELNRVTSRKELSVYDWFEKEKEKIEERVMSVNRDLQDNFSYISVPENKDVEFKFMAKSKRIKTKNGIENNLYDSDFSLPISPYDGVIHGRMSDLGRFSNKGEFSDAIFPLYEIRANGVIYLFEKNDFELVENKNEAVEIEYINKWEDELFFLERKLRNTRKWLDRCLKNIRKDAEIKLDVKRVDGRYIQNGYQINEEAINA